jgi:hypothetical protein
MSNGNIYQLTEEQLTKLLAAAHQTQTGVGAPPKKKTLGFGSPDECNPQYAAVYAMLSAGSPRLALARARGVPFAPFVINVRATFPDTSTAVVPDIGSDVKISQDVHIYEMMVRIFNRSPTANLNQFQAQSDFYYTFQSGIEATLDVQGAPRYTIADRFTPLANLMDAFNGNSRRAGHGWVLTYQEQLFMSFNATVTLPTAPMEVVCTFVGELPESQTFVRMDNRVAIEELRTKFGITITDDYEQTALLYG